MVFHWSLNDSKSPQVSRTLLSILTVLNNALAWMVCTRLPTSNSSSPFNNPLVTVRKVPITIGIIATFMFNRFFQFHSKVEVIILLFTFFQFYSVVSQKSKVDKFASFLFLLLQGLVFWPRLGDLSACQSPIDVYVSFSRRGAGLCIYHLFVWLNWNFLYISQLITLPAQSWLLLLLQLISNYTAMYKIFALDWNSRENHYY